ncbi:histidine phosphatase family protein [Exiguobacterium antarcticum]|uniref:histidine phosphatase family protein n=1 Tax=Exiguobacterium antarcticum TaxID=132920 RepID=UPI0003114C93|nr:histidine phosphatase family protein [Exiguobacterium antarcticum]
MRIRPILQTKKRVLSSEQGRYDAEQRTLSFEGIKPDQIYASPYRRAIETVQPLAEQYGLVIQEAAAFQERLLAPEELPDCQQAVGYVWEHPDENPYGGESNVTAQRRIVPEIKRLLEKHKDQTVVI